MRKTRHVARLEEERGKPIVVILTEAAEKYDTTTEAAASLCISRHTYELWLSKYHIQVRRVAFVGVNGAQS